MTEKRCTRCQMVKGEHCFAVRKNRRSRKSWCNPCMAAAARDWRLAHPKTARTATTRWRENNPAKVLQIERRRLYKRHGLSLEQVDLKLSAQSFKCANPGCGVALDRGRGKHAAHLDHDHVSGIVRDFLCHGCNVALGSLGDSCLRLAGFVVCSVPGRYAGNN